MIECIKRTTYSLWVKIKIGLRVLYCAVLLLLLIPAALFYCFVRGIRKLCEKTAGRLPTGEIPPTDSRKGIR